VKRKTLTYVHRAATNNVKAMMGDTMQRSLMLL